MSKCDEPVSEVRNAEWYFRMYLYLARKMNKYELAQNNFMEGMITTFVIRDKFTHEKLGPVVRINNVSGTYSLIGYN